LKIKYVIETHLHADFVSGHQEIAARTGAQIIFGAKAGVAFEHRAVREGDEIRMGQCCFALHRDARPHARRYLHSHHKPRRATKTSNRRHALHRRRRSPRSRGGKGYTPQMMA
jgi:hypothetical protein